MYMTQQKFAVGFDFLGIKDPKTAFGQELASCLINAQPLPAQRPAADDWQMIGRYPLTADAHFAARLGAFFYWTRCFENNVPFDNTVRIYLINLL